MVMYRYIFCENTKKKKKEKKRKEKHSLTRTEEVRSIFENLM